MGGVHRACEGMCYQSNVDSSKTAGAYYCIKHIKKSTAETADHKFTALRNGQYSFMLNTIWWWNIVKQV